MKIETSEKILDLTGQPIKLNETDLTVGKVVAQILMAPRKDNSYLFDKVKLLILAQQFYKEEETEMDVVDVEKLIKMVETDETWAPLITGRVLMSLKK